ncbi:MAG: FkbM family methyltransferase [Chitinophagaceae bacterium]|nr:FkbM family methyltransferase [Chitinophagaceae bacterium]
MTDTVTIQKPPFTIHFRPGTADEEVLKESFEKDIFFPGIPEYKILPGHIIIDIGAHIGCFSLLAADKVPQGKVYSFEPAAETYAVLEQNIRSNNLSNTKAFRVAMAAENGKTLLYHDLATGNWGHSITKKLSGETEEVNCITLENLFISEKIEQADLIKFNCEGAEFSILLYTPATVLRRIRCMLVLYHGFLEETISTKQVANHLTKAGFHIHYRYKNKADNSGWMIAYRAGFFENLLINYRTLPLRTALLIKEMKRKFKRAKQIIFYKG